MPMALALDILQSQGFRLHRTPPVLRRFPGPANSLGEGTVLQLFRHASYCVVFRSLLMECWKLWIGCRVLLLQTVSCNSNLENRTQPKRGSSRSGGSGCQKIGEKAGLGDAVCTPIPQGPKRLNEKHLPKTRFCIQSF